MEFFIPLLILIASAWCAVGILLAKWLKQAGHARPFSGRDRSGREVYGGGVGFGRMTSGEREERREVRLGEFGSGRVKGV